MYILLLGTNQIDKLFFYFVSQSNLNLKKVNLNLHDVIG